MSTSDHRDIVAALRDVPGVADAEVETDDGGGLGLLRLGLAPGVDEVEVASAVGRLLREQFGLGVDADRVQLVEDMQADAEDPHIEPSAASADRFRPSIRRMYLISSGLQVAVEVTLTFGERSAHGQSEGTATQTGVQRAVSTATLRAVEELLDGRARFELDMVELTPVGRDRAVLVALTMVSSAGSEKLTGAADVRDDVRQAVIRATLDALNRRVEYMVG